MSDDTTTALYMVVMRGEQHEYRFRGIEVHQLANVSAMLSDITGYKASFISAEISDLIVGEQKIIQPANGWRGEIPHFIVTRVE